MDKYFIIISLVLIILLAGVAFLLQHQSKNEINKIREKKKQEESNTTSSDSDNLDTLIDMWVDGKLEGPINDLLSYDGEVQNGGHLQFFENYNDNLYDMMISLKEILPSDFYNNLEKAYGEYKKAGYEIDSVDDFVNVALEGTLDDADNFYYSNDKIINKILQDYANSEEFAKIKTRK